MLELIQALVKDTLRLKSSYIVFALKICQSFWLQENEALITTTKFYSIGPRRRKEKTCLKLFFWCLLQNVLNENLFKFAAFKTTTSAIP
jgi:hypothetical protein